jgi:hypothetical protein
MKACLCARTPQSTFNATYRRILRACPSPALADVFACKLALGILYDAHARGGREAVDFHEFVLRVKTL